MGPAKPTQERYTELGFGTHSGVSRVGREGGSTPPEAQQERAWLSKSEPGVWVWPRGLENEVQNRNSVLILEPLQRAKRVDEGG